MEVPRERRLYRRLSTGPTERSHEGSAAQALTPSINFKPETWFLEKRAGHEFFLSNCWGQI